MVFILSVIDEFNDENISSKHQISIKAVEFNLKKAREGLGKLFKQIESPISIFAKSIESGNYYCKKKIIICLSHR